LNLVFAAQLLLVALAAREMIGILTLPAVLKKTPKENCPAVPEDPTRQLRSLKRWRNLGAAETIETGSAPALERRILNQAAPSSRVSVSR
jgi:hypothetical protein